MFRKKITDEIGGFDEDLAIASDRDLWLRILQKGSAIFLDKLFVKYRIHDDNLSIKNVQLREECVKKIMGKYRVKPMEEETGEEVGLKEKEKKKEGVKSDDQKTKKLGE